MVGSQSLLTLVDRLDQHPDTDTLIGSGWPWLASGHSSGTGMNCRLWGVSLESRHHLDRIMMTYVICQYKTKRNQSCTDESVKIAWIYNKVNCLEERQLLPEFQAEGARPLPSNK